MDDVNFEIWRGCREPPEQAGQQRERGALHDRQAQQTAWDLIGVSELRADRFISGERLCRVFRKPPTRCFGALLEALAGFGAPVAICGAMLVGLELSPMQVVVTALIADMAPVAFGAIAVPITTLAEITGLPVHHLGQMVGRQTPFLALIIPFVLVRRPINPGVRSHS